jgi:hypothetical protein
MKKILIILIISLLIGSSLPVSSPSFNGKKATHYQFVNKAEAKKKKKIKKVRCLTYFDIVLKVSKSECKLIKQKNKRSKRIDREYSACVNTLRSGLNDCKESARDRALSSEVLVSMYEWCEDLWNVDEGAQQCWNTRQEKMLNLWGQ